MEFSDLSPPAVPTFDQQRDALQKGLGRAMQWARAGKLLTEPLLEACLIDQRFDRQCEANRGKWLWELIRATQQEQAFREPVLQALHTVIDYGSACQLCELALHFSRHVDDEFARELFRFVERRPIPDMPEAGMEQLLKVGGESGLLFIARVRGSHLACEAWDWYDKAVVESAIEKWGQERVELLLEGAEDPEIRRYSAAWQAQVSSRNAERLPSTTLADRLETYTVSDVLEPAQTGEKYRWFRGWGMDADVSDLLVIQEHLWSEQNPQVLARLLEVFSNRPLPEFDARLIDLCQHSDENVRHWAAAAMEKNTHPLVRQFAWEQLAHPTIERSTVGAFIRNYQTGDEERLLETLSLPDDDCQRHSLLIDLTKVLEENETADCSKLGQVIYFHTPCQECRFYAARLLYQQGTAPDWLIEECRLDANEDCRDFDESVAKETGEL